MIFTLYSLKTSLERAKRWVRKKDIFSFGLLLIPVSFISCGNPDKIVNGLPVLETKESVINPMRYCYLQYLANLRLCHLYLQVRKSNFRLIKNNLLYILYLVNRIFFK